jgi:hypothetical protein
MNGALSRPDQWVLAEPPGLPQDRCGAAETGVFLRATFKEARTP